MADSSVTINSAAGTVPVDSRTATNGDQRQVVVQGNDGDNIAGVDSFGSALVSLGPSTLFYDAWSGAIDTTDKWTVVGNAPTTSGGSMSMPATASTYNALRTKDMVRPNAGHTYVANGVLIETATATGAGRFWGLGTPATTPAPGVLVQDGVGFEIDQATGALYAVTYAAGVRTIAATLTRPTDGLHHRYAIYFRVTSVTWHIDNTQNALSLVSFPNVQTPELPALFVRQNAASFTGTPVWSTIAHLTGDTSRQGQSISDPVIGTRMARVDASGSLRVATPAPTTGTLSAPALATSSLTVLSANTARRGATVFNDSSNIVYLALAASASTTAYSVQVLPGGYYELPGADTVYNGIVTAVASAASGNLRITELT